MMRIHTQCRNCRSENVVKFLDLGEQPLANKFVREEDLNNPEPRYPLQVCFCRTCHLVQLGQVVDKAELFEDYVYFSTGVPKFSEHFREYAEEVRQRFFPAPNGLVVEIGSNDGILLKFFKDAGFEVLGIDPAKNVAMAAETLDVPTLVDYFTEQLARRIVREHGVAKLMFANNVFAHMDNWHDVCQGVRVLLHKEGILVIEAPYLVDMFENLRYDSVYHEHLSYLAVRPLIDLFSRFDLEIFDVKVVPVHGNSLRLFVGHNGKHQISASIAHYLGLEAHFGLDKEQSYVHLAAQIASLKDSLVSLLHDLKAQGNRIAAYGAPAKGNTLLNYCHIGPELIDYAREDMPSKHGMFTPGMHIPVQGTDGKVVPDYYLLLAWNYASSILEKEKEFLGKGGKFIIPVGDKISII